MRSSTTFCEYIWIDGTAPTQKLRSKTKIIDLPEYPDSVSEFPNWGYDGSSTGQASGNKSDCMLVPVYFREDPLRSTEDNSHFLVMCEVMNADGTPHASNQRAKLREVLGIEDPQEFSPAEHYQMSLKGDETPRQKRTASMMDCFFGLEQEYTLFQGSRPLGFPEDRRFPIGQGPYYCGVGADEAFGRAMVEKHMEVCCAADILMSGINSEVMPGQWEFQIGPLGPLEVGDQLWLARWLLYRIGEDFGINATLDAKPVSGDWNGAGMHTNFSTKAMREPAGVDANGSPVPGGIDSITEFCEKAGLRVPEHLAAYGHGIETRLTGAHETCSYREFKYGVSDRTASIRIPLATSICGFGYLEDRRPNANACPYMVATVVLKTAYDLW